LAQQTPSAKDRFLALTARSKDRFQKAAKGRLDPFAAPFGYDLYLREPDGWSRREADICRSRLHPRRREAPSVHGVTISIEGGLPGDALTPFGLFAVSAMLASTAPSPS
jgi:hypothetical protein